MQRSRAAKRHACRLHVRSHTFVVLASMAVTIRCSNGPVFVVVDAMLNAYLPSGLMAPWAQWLNACTCAGWRPQHGGCAAHPTQFLAPLALCEHGEPASMLAHGFSGAIWDYQWPGGGSKARLPDGGQAPRSRLQVDGTR